MVVQWIWLATRVGLDANGSLRCLRAEDKQGEGTRKKWPEAKEIICGWWLMAPASSCRVGDDDGGDCSASVQRRTVTYGWRRIIVPCSMMKKTKAMRMLSSKVWSSS